MADDGRSLRRELTEIKAGLRALKAVVTRQGTHIGEIAAAIPVVTAQSERFGILLDPLAVGNTVVPVTWPNPFPDAAYMVSTELSVPVANLGVVVFASAGQKTTTGCTVVVRSLAALPIAVILDVLGIRT